jgi:hypothetical protein
MLTVMNEGQRLSVPGLVKSAVFAKSFRLEVHPDEGGHPEYTLRMR